jgi:hypothetical protein
MHMDGTGLRRIEIGGVTLIPVAASSHRLPGLATNPLRVPSTTSSLFYRIDLRAKGETRALSAWRPGGLVI